MSLLLLLIKFQNTDIQILIVYNRKIDMLPVMAIHADEWFQSEALIFFFKLKSNIAKFLER